MIKISRKIYMSFVKLCFFIPSFPFLPSSLPPFLFPLFNIGWENVKKKKKWSKKQKAQQIVIADSFLNKIRFLSFFWSLMEPYDDEVLTNASQCRRRNKYSLIYPMCERSLFGSICLNKEAMEAGTQTHDGRELSHWISLCRAIKNISRPWYALIVGSCKNKPC